MDWLRLLLSEGYEIIEEKGFSFISYLKGNTDIGT